MKTVFDLMFVLTFSVCLTASVTKSSDAKDRVGEKSLRRLSLIVDTIDQNKDGYVTQKELKKWITFLMNRDIMKDVHSQWDKHRVRDGGKLSWSVYRKDEHGFMTDEEENDFQKYGDSYIYTKFILRDKMRWAAADVNSDGLLSKKEYVSFLHPELSVHMKDIIIYETMDDMDLNKDNKVSINECIVGLWLTVERSKKTNFIINAEEQCKRYRDKDGNGYLDIEEIKDWVLPDNVDHAEAKSRHLVYESDSDADGKLTKEEILVNYDLFVGSRDTDFGKTKMKHDEL